MEGALTWEGTNVEAQLPNEARGGIKAPTSASGQVSSKVLIKSQS